MNHTFNIRQSLLTSASVLLFLGAAHGAENRPQNYNEIKTELEIYANADDLLDEKLLVGREKLRSRGDEAVPALLVLFKENADDHYRVSIIDALRHNRGQKEKSVTFLAEQMRTTPKEWQGELWIIAAIDFLTEANPSEARTVALKGLSSESVPVKRASIRSLATVGKSEDAQALNAISQKSGEIREIIAAAKLAITEINTRTTRK